MYMKLNGKYLKDAEKLKEEDYLQLSEKLRDATAEYHTSVLVHLLSSVRKA